MNRPAGKAKRDAKNRSAPLPSHQSSLIYDARYDEEEATLDITFTSGKVYRYRDVPLEVYVDLTEAESKGAFFNSDIRGAFEFFEVTARRRRF